MADSENNSRVSCSAAAIDALLEGASAYQCARQLAVRRFTALLLLATNTMPILREYG
jgi:hypothetical protein